MKVFARAAFAFFFTFYVPSASISSAQSDEFLNWDLLPENEKTNHLLDFAKRLDEWFLNHGIHQSPGSDKAAKLISVYAGSDSILDTDEVLELLEDLDYNWVERKFALEKLMNFCDRTDEKGDPHPNGVVTTKEIEVALAELDEKYPDRSELRVFEGRARTPRYPKAQVGFRQASWRN